MTITKMEVGNKYLVRYQIKGVHRRKREMVAKYLGHTEEKLIFTGRPVFGTSELEPEHLISVKKVTMGTDCYADRVVKE